MATINKTREQIATFLTEMKGSLFLMNGTTLSINVAMLALCEIIIEKRCTNMQKICIICKDNDPSCSSLLKKQIPFIVERVLTNIEVANRRISQVNGDGVESRIKKIDIPISMVLRQAKIKGIDIFSEIREKVKESELFGDRDVFVYCKISSITHATLLSLLEMLNGLRCNLWVQSPCPNLKSFIEYAAQNQMTNNVYYLNSSFQGMSDNHSDYQIKLDIVNGVGEEVIRGIKLNL